MEYFFDDYDNPVRKDYFRQKLVDENGYVDLSAMYFATDNKHLIEQGDITAAREATLQYLLPLLKEGKLRVKVTIPRLATEEEVENIKKSLNDPWLEKNQRVGITCVTASTKIYTREESEEAIESMQKAWNDPEVPVTAFEMDVLFTLPQNKFPGE